jgi:hypothetical protein
MHVTTGLRGSVRFHSHPTEAAEIRIASTIAYLIGLGIGTNKGS